MALVEAFRRFVPGLLTFFAHSFHAHSLCQRWQFIALATSWLLPRLSEALSRRSKYFYSLQILLHIGPPSRNLRTQVNHFSGRILARLHANPSASRQLFGVYQWRISWIDRYLCSNLLRHRIDYQSFLVLINPWLPWSDCSQISRIKVRDDGWRNVGWLNKLIYGLFHKFEVPCNPGCSKL